MQAAINAASTYPAAGPAQSADLQQDQPGGRADADPGADLEDLAAVEGPGSRRHPAGAEDLAGARRRTGSISGGQKPAVRIQANPTASSYDMSLEDCAPPWRQANVESGQGELRRRRGSPTPSAPTISCCQRSVPAADHRLQKRRPVRLSDVATVIDGIENVKQAAWMN